MRRYYSITCSITIYGLSHPQDLGGPRSAGLRKRWKKVEGRGEVDTGSW